MSVTSSTIKALLCSTLIASLAACSSGGGGGSGGGLKPNEAVKPGSAGQFSATKEAALEKYGDVPKDLKLPETAECAGKTNDEKWKSSYPSELKAGQSFTEAHSGATPESQYSALHTLTVTEKTPTLLKMSTVISNIAMIPSTGQIPATVQIDASCPLDKADSDCETTFVNFDPKSLPETTYCWLRDISSENETGTASLGTYKLSNGTTVNAQKIERVRKGNIACQKGSTGKEEILGEGTEIETKVLTDELVALRQVSCEGHLTVYRYRTIIKKDGTTLRSDKEEILSGSKR